MKDLISAIMPTWRRANYVPQAIKCFLDQTWPEKELIILDDDERPGVKLLIPRDPRIRYVMARRRRTIPEKRNACCFRARGKYIAHWDDDDWSDPRRLEVQMEHLEKSGKTVTGFHSMLFYDIEDGQAFSYKGVAGYYACGTSLFYTRDFWERNQWDVQHRLSSDNHFVRRAYNRNHLATMAGNSLMVARVHPRNSNPKNPVAAGVNFTPVEASSLPAHFGRF